MDETTVFVKKKNGGFLLASLYRASFCPHQRKEEATRVLLGFHENLARLTRTRMHAAREERKETQHYLIIMMHIQISDGGNHGEARISTRTLARVDVKF